MSRPSSGREALTLALTLGMTAPSREQFELVVELVDQIASTLTLEDVEYAKRESLRRVGAKEYNRV